MSIDGLALYLWSNVVKSFPICCARFPRKAKKSLETLGFQGFIVVEISGIELLTF
jgi:hypothetical protein